MSVQLDRVQFAVRPPVLEAANHRMDFGGNPSVLDPIDSLDVITRGRKERVLTDGQCGLAQGLIRYGTTYQFPDALGLNISAFAKIPHFNYEFVGGALQEMVDHAKNSSVIIGVDNSGRVIGEAVNERAKKPILHVNKKEADHFDFKEEEAIAAIGLKKSFSDGKSNILSIHRDELIRVISQIKEVPEEKIQQLLQDGNLAFLGPILATLVDDFFHMATINLSVLTMLQELKKQTGLDLKVLNSISFFKMCYTNTDQRVSRQFGIQPKGILNISGVGLNPEPWFSIREIEKTAFTYFNS